MVRITQCIQDRKSTIRSADQAIQVYSYSFRACHQHYFEHNSQLQLDNLLIFKTDCSYILQCPSAQLQLYQYCDTYVIYACGQLTHTCAGTNMHTDEPMISHNDCMGSPYAYRQPIRVWVDKNCPYAHMGSRCLVVVLLTFINK